MPEGPRRERWSVALLRCGVGGKPRRVTPVAVPGGSGIHGSPTGSVRGRSLKRSLSGPSGIPAGGKDDIAVNWIKLLPLGLAGLQALVYYLRRAHRGWQLDFEGLPRETIAHRGHAITVCTGSRRIATADSAWVGFELSRPWTFALARQGWLRLDAELVTGVREIDERLHIGIESTRLADALIRDGDLRMHLLDLDRVLARFEARFQRLDAAGRELSLLVRLRHGRDPAPLWRALIDWLVVLDRALDVAARPAGPRVRSSRPRGGSATPSTRS